MNRYLFAVLVFAPVLAGAQDRPTEITPFAGYRFGGTFEATETADEYEMEDSASFGLILNFPHKANTRWEILYSQQNSEAVFSDPAAADPEVDVDTMTLQLGGIYLFDSGRAQPYLAATIGGTHIRTESAESMSDTFISGSIGVGMMFMPSARVGIRVEARAYGTLLDSSTDLFCRTGPDANICAVRIDGTFMTQIETFAGITFRF